MHIEQLQTQRRWRVLAWGGLTACLAMLGLTETAQAVPTLSRKYHTSCVTCHTVFPKLNDTGEAFRRNGYQFASGDELLVKEEPIPMGRDTYKDMFPNSIWPSTLPHLPPVFIRAQMRNIIHTDPGPDGKKWDMDFPHAVALGGVGTFGENIAAWWEIEFEPSGIVEEGETPNVERAFVQFSNLFAWSDEEDDNGMRTGNRWITLPKHALNIRAGKMEPQVFSHIFSQHARVGITRGLPIRQRIGDNAFRFEPAQSAAVEAHGILRQRNSYVVGYANGGVVSGGQLDDNNHKDVYFRISRKWFGFPLDGVVGQAEPADSAAIRGQNADEGDDEMAPVGLDFWRSVGLKTGVFGWWGKSELALNKMKKTDNFRRIGADARLQWQDLDIYAMGFWGHDNFAGLVGGTNLGGEDWFSYSVQADYMVKPWILGFVRYEQTVFGEGARGPNEEARIVPGVVMLIRQNMKLGAEWALDTTGKDTGGPQATDQFLIQLDYVY